MATKKNSSPKRLTRDTDNQMIAGVCSGIAKYFDIDPTIVRLIYALLTIVLWFFPGIVVYIIAMFIMPAKNA